jgi:zinc transport system substrate-binding protein
MTTTKSAQRLFAGFLGVMVVTAAPQVAQAEIQVVATMKPVHALVAMVMGDTGSPKLIVDGATSPHAYVLKPSDAKALGTAAVVFRMSERVETFTAKVVKSLPRAVEVVTLADTPGLTLLPVRTSDTFKSGNHAGHDHDDDHDHAKVAGGAQAMDGHAWLDPDNASVMIDRIAAVLSAKDAVNAAIYATNAARAKAEMGALKSEIAAVLKPVAGRPFIVFHDAMQYFEARFGLTAAGAITVSPDIPPSAKRLAGLRKTVAALGAKCVFSEPNFAAKVVTSVIEGSAAKASVVDPEGAMLAAGPGHYAATLRGLAAAHAGCLGR